jgi:hypothetical protein
MVWDKGTYRNIKKDKDGKEIKISDAYKKGQIEVQLHGKKLEGKFALIKTKSKKQWLLIKMKDEFESKGEEITKLKPNSSCSGKSLEDIR